MRNGGLIERAQRVLSVNTAPSGCNGVFIDVCPDDEDIPITGGWQQLMHENRQRVWFFTGRTPGTPNAQ
jgi:hypothetical protein